MATGHDREEQVRAERARTAGLFRDAGADRGAGRGDPARARGLGAGRAHPATPFRPAGTQHPPGRLAAEGIRPVRGRGDAQLLRACALLGIWLVHSRPRQPAGPRQNRGAIGDALDSALAETTIGLYQTEIIAPRSPWNGLADVEIATLEYTDWHNHRRLHGACHDLTPAELERAYYSHKGGLPKEPVPTN